MLKNQLMAYPRGRWSSKVRASQPIWLTKDESANFILSPGGHPTVTCHWQRVRLAHLLYLEMCVPNNVSRKNGPTSQRPSSVVQHGRPVNTTHPPMMAPPAQPTSLPLRPVTNMQSVSSSQRAQLERVQKDQVSTKQSSVSRREVPSKY